MAGKALITLSIALMACTVATPAYAYLDPGTGSLILQGLIAGVAVMSLTVKIYWYKFLSFFKKTDLHTEEQVCDDEEQIEKHIEEPIKDSSGT
jgi:uncharacterized membrane protein